MGRSMRKRLAELFPDSLVVKGFNTVSIWELQTGAHDGSRQVRAVVLSVSAENKYRVI